MTPKKKFALVSVLVGSLLTSCNLYSPLEGSGSVQDHLEIGQACLTDGNYDCAAAEYGALPAGTQRQQKLCALYLSQAGFTLSTLVTVFKNASDGAREKTLGVVANKLLPYTVQKQTGADKAIVECQAYLDLNPAGDEGKLAELLRALSYFTHCATLMAKTTSVQTVSDADDTCNTPSTQTKVSATSISAAGDGSVGAGSPGMCRADAVACFDDIDKMASNSLSAEQAEIKDAFDEIRAKFSGPAAQIARAGVISTL